MFKRLVVLLGLAALCVPLAGCWSDQQQAAADCSSASPRPHDAIVHLDLREKLAICMEMKGYLFALHSNLCAGQPNPGRSPFCYEPEGDVARWAFYAEMMFHSKPLPHNAAASEPKKIAPI